MFKTLLLPLLVNLQLLLFLAVNLFSLPAAHAQHNDISLKRNCSAVEVLNKQIATEPGRAKALAAIEEHTRQFIRNQASSRTTSSVITVPVVVHVVYNTPEQNISTEQIRSQIAALNKDFRRLNTDADNTWSQAADVQIEFKLASVNPMGTSTQGITRTSTTVTSFSTNDWVKSSKSGGRNGWPAQDYLNIWVCNLNGAAGYAQFPGGSAATDGIVVGYKFFGTTGTAIAPYNLGRTTTHEVGHWLNLHHIWGDGDCTADDMVDDTPPADAPNYGCAVGRISCNTVDMVQNYMDYSDDPCMNLFTAGQKARMRALFDRGGARSSLLSSAGLGGGSTSSCTKNTLNLNLTLDYYGSETTWEIKSKSGQVVASGGPYEIGNATIRESYCLSDGCYDFVIKDAFGDGICCNYGNGSYSLTDANGQVLAKGSTFGAVETKSFCLGGNTSTPPVCPVINFNNYTISGFSNQDTKGTHQVQDAGVTLHLNGNTWKQIPYNYTVTPSTVLEFEFRSTKEGEIQGIAFENDNSISPGFSFRVYGNQNWGIANYNDYSGTAWKKYTIPVGSFFTGNFNKLVFIGDDDANALQTAYFRNVKVYEGSCGGSRVIAARDIEGARIGNEAEQHFGVHLYPNPGKDKLNLRLAGEKAANATLYDIRGKKVWSVHLIEDQSLTLDITALPAGIYTLRTVGESGEVINQKLIKQ